MGELFFKKKKNIIVLHNHPVLSLVEQKDTRFFKKVLKLPNATLACL